jgi:hypothetical protein
MISQRKNQLSAGLVLIAVLCVVIACEQPSPPVAPIDDRQDRTLVAESTIAIQSSAPLPHKVGLVIQEPGANGAVALTVIAEALARNGVEVVQGSPAGRTHLVIAMWCATRAGDAWGGIPMQQAQLRYAMLNARSHDRLGAGTESASYADPTVASARLGAMRKAAENAARRIVVSMRQLPPPEPLLQSPAVAERAPLSVAALPFHNATGRADLTGWCETLSAIGAQELVASGRYRVVERSRLNEVLKEVDLTGLFAAAPSNMSDLGRQIGVDLLLVGELAIRPDGPLALTARFVQSSDGQVRQVIIAAAPVSRTNDLEAQFRRQLPRPVEDWIVSELEQLELAPDAWPSNLR